MFSQPSSICFELPEWFEGFVQEYVPSRDRDERMKFVIAAARMNVEQGTGGPFAAAVFEAETGSLVSLGVNLVTSQGMSMLHAEIIALSIAQKKLDSYDLADSAHVSYELISSAEPCAMCLGAIHWSGVRYVATAAREEDITAIGFDEGPKPENWIKSLNDRGIEVTTDIERASACSVLQLYLENDGLIYNPK